MMSLYTVTAMWYEKGERRKHRWIQTAVVLADSNDMAIEKFKASVSYPENAVLSADVRKDGIFTLKEHRLS